MSKAASTHPAHSPFGAFHYRAFTRSMDRDGHLEHWRLDV